ncbi:hypothetical protein EDF63_3448 [Curtobacterium sp. JUb34]|uniref:hypothetical protein n=1 Tax=Curtobacterium sp. JUb34 TaxID=2485109 RepID=UPI000F4834C6|nr:hypothetical protein [Curtobacterium sp. JUb34]ROR28856.1 hypothetical protein EDF63_3448 [Curtobacterium sp. JUb34]
MDSEDVDAAWFAGFLEKERKKLLQIHGREEMRRGRAALIEASTTLDAIVIAPGGVAASIDDAFAPTATLPPSSLIRTQLRLALHYLQTADGDPAPSLSSFVVLRVAIECIATGCWLMASSRREAILRALKRMWWDTQNAADMAVVADGRADPSELQALKDRLTAIVGPMKRLDLDSVTGGQRPRLSGAVRDASRSLREENPTALKSAWMLCAALSHGNIPVSAGVGIAPSLIQDPSQHLIDFPAFASVWSLVVDDFSTAVRMFEKHATVQHKHQGPRDAASS